MNCYIYKSFKNSLFIPDELIVEPFLYPNSCKAFLKGDERPFLYLFKKKPNDKIIEEYELEKTLVLEDFLSEKDIKDYFRKSDVYLMLSLL